MVHYVIVVENNSKPVMIKKQCNWVGVTTRDNLFPNNFSRKFIPRQFADRTKCVKWKICFLILICNWLCNWECLLRIFYVIYLFQNFLFGNELSGNLSKMSQTNVRGTYWVSCSGSRKSITQDRAQKTNPADAEIIYCSIVGIGTQTPWLGEFASCALCGVQCGFKTIKGSCQNSREWVREINIKRFCGYCYIIRGMEL